MNRLLDKRILRQTAQVAAVITVARLFNGCTPSIDQISQVNSPIAELRSYPCNENSAALSELIDTATLMIHGDKCIDAMKRAVDELVKQGKTNTSTLISALDDNSSYVRLVAGDALGTIKDPSAVSPIIELLEKQPGWKANETAICLGKIGDPKAIPALLNKVKNKPYMDSELFPGAFIIALERIGTAAVPALLELAELKQDPSGQNLFAPDRSAEYVDPIRQNAFISLGKLHDYRAIPVLMSASKDPNEEIRKTASRVLAELVDPAVRTLKDVPKDGSSSP